MYFSKVFEAVVVSCGPCGDITANAPWRCHIKAASNASAIGGTPPICIEDWIALGPWVAPFARPMRSSQHTSNTGAFKADFKGVAFQLACSRRKPRCIDAASGRKRVSRPHLELAGETDVTSNWYNVLLRAVTQSRWHNGYLISEIHSEQQHDDHVAYGKGMWTHVGKKVL